MNGHPRHPGITELAEFRAGVSDTANGERLAAHLAECPDCASLGERLDRIPALLASVPPPAMPADVEARILSALHAEAVPRSPVAASSSPASPTALSAAARTRRRAWRRSPVAASLGGLTAAAACVGLAFAGLWLSGPAHPAPPASGGTASGGTVHAKPNVPASGGPSAHHGDVNPMIGQSTFTVIAAATNFLPSTLRAQIMRQLPATGARSGGSLPSQSLVGCVTRLLGPATPMLVERAEYESRPAYVIAESSRAWVVPYSCTAADPRVLATVTLPPASGR
jgi:hypothetical protein